MKGPLVSVLMTAYNREQYIAEAIESVLAQTFEDFEVIVVDDCSQDRTVEVARSYANDPRVVIHQNERNLGDYVNRNRAASFARGKYLKYLDSDDVMTALSLEVMTNGMEKFPSAALGMQRPEMGDEYCPLLLTPVESYRQQFLANGLFGVGPSETIIRTSAFKRVGGFTGKRFIGDFELWLKLASQFNVVKFMRGLVRLRAHPEQEISTERKLFPYGTMAYRIYEDALLAEDCPLADAERTRALRRIKRRQGRSLFRIAFIDRRPYDALRIMRHTMSSFRTLPLALTREN